ncbi:MAG: sulfurtransferase TusA family protein [Proteobacteria bacterium]|nr:sulfurtransferase TusA family protein [Pseudomonadota bacterium]
MSKSADHFLDITADVCPITFVKTKLLIERMKPGEIAVVLLADGEPLHNVPRSVREQGHEVLTLNEDPKRVGTHILRVLKAAD